MKNFEKFKTKKERFDEFFKICSSAMSCGSCKLSGNNRHGCSAECALAWLDLEAEDDKPMDCPFCGEECVCGGGYVECLNDNCCYSSGNRKRSDAEAIAAHNSMCKAVAAYKKSEAAK